MFRSHSETIRTNPKSKSNLPRTFQAFSCDLCDEACWLSETDVELHRKEAHFAEIRDLMEKYTERFCTVCMTLQESHTALIMHIKTRHLLSSPLAKRVERQIFICDHCDHIFFNKNLLQVHIMYLHLWTRRERLTKMFTCPKCNKLCHLKSIWFHFQLHEIPSLSVCEICLSHFPSIKELEKHLKTHAMYYQCDICDYNTSKDVHFENHLDKHYKAPLKAGTKMGKVVREAFVGLNNRPCKSIVKYNIHHSLKGLDLPRVIHICGLCREICTDKIEAKNHILRDHMIVAETKKQSRCLCGEEFFNRVLLRHHIFKAGKEQRDKHRELGDNEQIETHAQQTTTQVVSVEIDNSASVQPLESEQVETAEEEVPKKRRRLSTDNKEVTTENEEVPVENEEVTVENEEVSTENEEVPIETVIIVTETDGDEISNVELKRQEKQLLYVFTNVDEEQIVTTDQDTTEEVIGL